MTEQDVLAIIGEPSLKQPRDDQTVAWVWKHSNLVKKNIASVIFWQGRVVSAPPKANMSSAEKWGHNIRFKTDQSERIRVNEQRLEEEANQRKRKERLTSVAIGDSEESVKSKLGVRFWSNDHYLPENKKIVLASLAIESDEWFFAEFDRENDKLLRTQVVTNGYEFLSSERDVARERQYLADERQRHEAKAAAQRTREEYVAAHPERSSTIKSALLAQRLALGMTPVEVILSWGRPTDKNIAQGVFGRHEQWVFSLTRYAYFENGKLTSWQISE